MEGEFVEGTVRVKRGFMQMQKHGVIMDVTNVEQAQIAEEAGAVAVMALDKLPYDVRTVSYTHLTLPTICSV